MATTGRIDSSLVVELPDELVEDILLRAWATKNLHQRWMLYRSIISLCRQWRSVMLAVRLRTVVIENPDDYRCYKHIVSEYQGPQWNPDATVFSRAHVCTTLPGLERCRAILPDCAYIEVDLTINNARYGYNHLRNLPHFPSLSFLSLVYPVLRRQIGPGVLPPIPPIASPHTLSLHHPIENVPGDLEALIPVLSAGLPNINTLHLSGPIPLTRFVGYFPKVELILLYSPPLRASTSSTGPMRTPLENPTHTMFWTITAAVKSGLFKRRERDSKNRIVLFGCIQRPTGWDRMVEVCLQRGIILEYRVAY